MRRALSRADNIYNQMKKGILYGYPQFKPGELLNENTLAKYYESSKTPVREALNRLRYESLVEVIPYKGYFVTNLSYRDLIEMFELRSIMECGAVDLAVKNISNSHINRLREMTDQHNLPEFNSISFEFRKLNLEFHTFVAECSGNSRLALSVKQILEQMQRALFLDITENEVEDLFGEHRELVAALEQKNANLAKGIVLKQINLAKKRILSHRHDM